MSTEMNESVNTSVESATAAATAATATATQVLNVTGLEFWKNEKGTSVNFKFVEMIDGFKKNKDTGLKVEAKVQSLIFSMSELREAFFNLSKVEGDLFDDLAYIFEVKKQVLDQEFLSKLFFRSKIAVNRILYHKGDVVNDITLTSDQYRTEIVNIVLSSRGKSKLDALVAED